MDISSPKEFTAKMKSLMGGNETAIKNKEDENDPETEEIIKQLQDLINKK